jgi:hypothetical protein
MSPVLRSRPPRHRRLAFAHAASLGLVCLALLGAFVRSVTTGHAQTRSVTFASYLESFV